MKKSAAFLFSVLHKLAMPKNFRMVMLVIPFALGFMLPDLCDVGGNIGGCTGG